VHQANFDGWHNPLPIIYLIDVYLITPKIKKFFFFFFKEKLHTLSARVKQETVG
jgi:hypothetical protein